MKEEIHQLKSQVNTSKDHLNNIEQYLRINKIWSCTVTNILQKQFSSVYTREPDRVIPTFESRTESSITNLYVRGNGVKRT